MQGLGARRRWLWGEALSEGAELLLGVEVMVTGEGRSFGSAMAAAA